MPELSVQLGPRSYPILIGEGLLARADSWTPALGVRSLVVTCDTVAALHLHTLRAALGDHPHAVLALPSGDTAKSLTVVEAIVRAAIESGLGRDGTLIALGGGAIGDVAGFAAAVYHRGIPFIQIPTTLLAQVDSSVGGKTAVNHPLGKNFIGAFHQPRRVVIDTATLDTLPPREFAAGIAEVIKCALLGGHEFIEWLEGHMPALVERDAQVLSETILRCCTLKAAIVEADETEQGRRATLNLGHTFGHALETLYAGELLHGEAVALGCLMAAHLSMELGWLDPKFAQRIHALVAKAGLRTGLPAPRPVPDAMRALMGRDKKNLTGQLRLVLLRDACVVEITSAFTDDALERTLRHFTGGAG